MRPVDTAGKLRALTATAKAIDPVEVLIYLPGAREPIKGVIGGYILVNPDGKPDLPTRCLTLQVIIATKGEADGTGTTTTNVG